MDYKEFMGLVAKMRQAQKNYFRAQMPQSKKLFLEESKMLEKQVDQQIQNFNNNQKQLFT